MTVTPRDPLLAAARLVLILSMGITLAAASAFALAFPGVLIMHGLVAQKLAEHGVSPDIVPEILTVLALLAAASALSFLFLRQLMRIVGTVAEGDPFVPVNARRLRAMAWLSLGINAALVGIAVASDVARGHHRAGDDFSFVLGGVLLALVLFVLARVFREGTRMRDELEGTV